MNMIPLLRAPQISFTKDYVDFRSFAIQRHREQKYGELPYAYHLACVEGYLEEFGYTEYKYRVAAWLHDSVEDAGVPYQTISDAFGPDVVSLVWACTGVGLDRATRNKCIYRKLREYPDAAPVKVCDRISHLVYGARNKVNKLDMYLAEWPEFKANVEPLMLRTKRDRYLWSSLDEVTLKVSKANGR
jgi:(p)ppGpp synthase/HD superfamily hydrolase